QIAINAGYEGSVIVEQIKAQSGNIGFNAATGEFVDMVKAGIIDPAKVTRTALQNAASIASLVLTTEALVAEIPKKEKSNPSPGGDMDFQSAPPPGGRRGIGSQPSRPSGGLHTKRRGALRPLLFGLAPFPVPPVLCAVSRRSLHEKAGFTPHPGCAATGAPASRPRSREPSRRSAAARWR